MDTIFHASKLCQQVRCEKSRVEQDDPLSTEKFYITSSWVLFVVGLVLFVLGLQYEDLKSTLTSIGTIFIATPALISVVIVIISITKQPILIDLEKECLLRLNQYLERQNTAYKKKGLHWSVGDECMWLQLESI